MKHRIAGRRLDRTTEHRTAMFRNLVTSLLRHERITTTTPKAKELKRYAEKIITLGKRATMHARRIAHRDVRDADVLQKLFGPIAERYKTREGGYTRVVRIGRRVGDNAEMAVIELVDRAPVGDASGQKPAEETEKPAKKSKPPAKAEPRAKAKTASRKKSEVEAPGGGAAKQKTVKAKSTKKKQGK